MAQAKECPGCGTVTEGELPAHVRARVGFGPETCAQAANLTAGHHIPVCRSTLLLCQLAGIAVSTGWMAGIRGRAASLAEASGFMDRVRELLKTAPAVHADETPARAAGGTRYVHLACTRYLTCMHTGDRSADAINAGGVLPGYSGVIVRDGYAGYGHLTDALHAWCWVHLLRDLKGLYGFEPSRQSWASQMAGLLIQARDAASAARQAGRSALDAVVLEDLVLGLPPVAEADLPVVTEWQFSLYSEASSCANISPGGRYRYPGGRSDYKELLHQMAWSLLEPFHAMYKRLLNTASEGFMLVATGSGTRCCPAQLEPSKLLHQMAWSPPEPFHAMYKRLLNTASEGPTLLATGSGTRCCPAQLEPSKLLHQMAWSPPEPFHAMYKRPLNTASEGPTLLATGSGTRCCPAQLEPSKLLHQMAWSPPEPFHAMYKRPLNTASEGPTLLATGSGTRCCPAQLEPSKLLHQMAWSLPEPFHAMYKRPLNTASEGPTLLATGSGTRCCPAQLEPSKLLHQMAWSPPEPFHAMYKRPLNTASEGPTLLATGSGTRCCSEKNGLGASAITAPGRPIVQS